MTRKFKRFGREARSKDDIGKVVIRIYLSRPNSHVSIPGNIIRTIALENERVSDVVRFLEQVLFGEVSKETGSTPRRPKPPGQKGGRRKENTNPKT